jgi:hypothetical protein
LHRCFPAGFLLVAGLFLHGATHAEVAIDDYKHMGVATCASSVCHGKLSAQTDRNVWLNEYRIWTRARRHSETYRLLENGQSRSIARNLGLPSATTAKVCLDCHADNVPADKRGPKFQITDGVSCEACHGGAENWIESHAEPGATHEDNLARGMYPTESPQARARLCLTCHLGTDEKFATHDIMGAGHPRLSFELEAFTANQPAHYEVDDDYRRRKGEIAGFNLWLTGQLQNAVSYLELIRSDFYPGRGQFPELAFYDCHACHHTMDDKRWTPERGGPGVAPGSPRLQDQHLLLLEVVAGVLESTATASEIRLAAEAFVAAGQNDAANARSVAARLLELLDRHQSRWATAKYTLETVRSVRRALIRAAADGRMSDFNAAEQIYLALESLSYSIGDRQTLESTLDSLYLEVESGSKFDPASFAAAARRSQDRF